MLPGGVWTVLLVVSITAIVLAISREVSRNSSTVSTPVPPSTSICHERPIKIFIEYVKCDKTYMMRRRYHEALYGEGQTPTKVKLLELTSHQCTDEKVAAKACFNDVIKDCNSTLKAKLNDLIATGVGFLCQPEERGVEPAITYVIKNMIDEDLAETKLESTCNITDTCQLGVNIDFHTPSLDGLAQSLQRYATSYIQCTADAYQAAQFVCPNWRAELLMRKVGPLASYPLMGVRLPFSQQDMDDMFQL